MVLVTCKVVDSDEIWDEWAWDIHKDLIGTINARIYSECKRSSPYCCESLLVSSFPVLCSPMCAVNKPQPIADSCLIQISYKRPHHERVHELPPDTPSIVNKEEIYG